MSLKCETIAFVSFESEFAPGGGLAVVMRNLPRVIAKSRNTILITPFFPQIQSCHEAYYLEKVIQDTGLKTSIKYDNISFPIEILKFIDKQHNSSFKIYFVYSRDFFFAPNVPYVNPGRKEQLFN